MSEQQWNKPNVEPIHLLDGRVVETEVNGKSLDGNSGYVLVDGRDIKVKRNMFDGEWEEVRNDEPPGDDIETIEQHIQGLYERDLAQDL